MFLYQRRKRRRNSRVLLRGRQSKMTPGSIDKDTPLRFVVGAVGAGAGGARPSLDPAVVGRPRKSDVASTQGQGSEKPPRPRGVHEDYQSPYSSMALEKVYEALERNITSPTPSFFSGRTEGALSGVASARASSDLNHGRAFRSLDQTPPSTAPRPSISQVHELATLDRRSITLSRPGTSGSRPVTAISRPGTSGSRPNTAGSITRPRSSSLPAGQPLPRRPSQIKRDLLAALESSDVVAVVRQSDESYTPPDDTVAPSAFDRYRPP